MCTLCGNNRGEVQTITLTVPINDGKTCFWYTAMTQDEFSRPGQIWADSEADATNRLLQQGYVKVESLSVNTNPDRRMQEKRITLCPSCAAKLCESP